VEIVEHAVLKDRGAFITRLLEFAPALAMRRPPSSALVFALEYGKAHLIPLLAVTRRSLPRGRRRGLLASEGLV
jgi:hypothetical protein